MVGVSLVFNGTPKMFSKEAEPFNILMSNI